MSYIHEALKASAEQRRTAQSPVEPVVPPVTAAADKTGLVRWLGRVVLVMLLSLLLYWFWFPPAPEVQAPAATEPVDASVQPPAGESASVPDLSGVKIAIRKEAPEPVRPVPAPPPEVAEPAAVAAEPKSADMSRESEPGAAVPVDPFAHLPYLRQLPAAQQRELRDIRFTVHIYSDVPGSRMVKYQGRVLREGDFVRPGLRVEAIIPRSVVLQFKDLRFKVPAL
ncbi:general secretion pathway protein GspB [Marinobacterium marinum]|uniref:General secretion pathway protein GspB n=1 Tax=Marinobacterium marinum TaxID=2756129 RepID=A0A7W1WWK1_9GAMM|nr:general secretion pathway protein GspB [Marinobacterium marinum]MBA4501543.1 general secretion pathway protein GspB [Marinobacterium marinum]